VIPREGVESVDDVQRFDQHDVARVIPREGVESPVMGHHPRHQLTRVIPREGVERMVSALSITDKMDV